MALFELKNVARTFGQGDAATQALKDATFAIESGEFVSIMGPSGSGKSTLLHIMGLLDRATAGEYLFAGQNVMHMTDEQLAGLRNEKMGFIFQSFHLLSRVSVLENVILPLYYSNIPQSTWREKAETALNEMELSHRLDHFPSELSGGERQRVAIARALVNNPDVIFADEPTGNLDTKSGQIVMNLIDGLHHQGRTVVLITHEESAAFFGERLLMITDGKIVDDKRITTRTHVFAK